jgi:putative peptide zinc metalloprotease protein
MTPRTNTWSASNDRPLRLRMRHDLVAKAQEYLGRRYWVVKDPLRLRYFRFEEEEYSILHALDGESSLEQIRKGFERQYAPQKLTASELHRLVAMLHRAALLVSDLPGQGEQLLERAKKEAKKKWLSAASQLLSFRFRGVNPDRSLTWLDARLGWLFTWPAFAVAVCLALASLALVASNLAELQRRLPSASEFFAAQNWVVLALCLAATKICHELGHGLACKRFGGECPEMGLMFLCFTPCLYCNVSDSWMIPNKWQRAAVGAAGMYVELILASLATIVWWWTHPGLINHLALNVIFVCSVSTLVFNANPLMRYDGYYILSDLLEIPNLRQKATSLLHRGLSWLCLGIEAPADPFLPQRRKLAFAAFSVASTIYGMFISLSILLFLNQVLEPYGFKIVGQMMLVLTLSLMVFGPAWKLIKFLRDPVRWEKLKMTRLATTLAVSAAVIGGVLLIPVPHRVVCGVRIEPNEAEHLFVRVAGNLDVIHVEPGDEVQQGDHIVSLTNLDLETAMAKLEAERDRLSARRDSLNQGAISNERSALELPEIVESLATIEERIEGLAEEMQRLHIKAPCAGVVFAPATIPPPPDEKEKLRTWVGSPLEGRNLGAYCEEGVLICKVGAPGEFEGLIVIEEDSLEFVHAGQSVEVFLDGIPGRMLSGKIERISPSEQKTMPKSLSSKQGGQVETITDEFGREQPRHTLYEAQVLLDNSDGQFVAGMTGRAKIHTGTQSLGKRMWRMACQTFRFEL